MSSQLLDLRPGPVLIQDAFACPSVSAPSQPPASDSDLPRFSLAGLQPRAMSVHIPLSVGFQKRVAFLLPASRGPSNRNPAIPLIIASNTYRSVEPPRLSSTARALCRVGCPCAASRQGCKGRVSVWGRRCLLLPAACCSSPSYIQGKPS